jgi:hypothetical protein
MFEHCVPHTNTLIEMVRQLIDHPHAWPGGYHRVLLMEDGGTLCLACTKAEYANIKDSAENDIHDGWLPAATFVNWEDQELYCAHCGNKIPAEYEN